MRRIVSVSVSCKNFASRIPPELFQPSFGFADSFLFFILVVILGLQFWITKFHLCRCLVLFPSTIRDWFSGALTCTEGGQLYPGSKRLETEKEERILPQEVN